ncbi:amino acid ABC transporter permease [Nocardioides marmoriginsengisoli]|uniref:Amino acid ABC transporter permease n=1 Tax=Nocardioides marmoriginsengisoli TaxID=661483 RepID=A0A3N0CET1_9ACTN|nr:amino acid ABC transporter permease [Nocardioides marmoriginsengisoli]RNL61952.1 amino acid ABC transporter permease [Nocardioides marmoriginsengisoli]
MGTILSTLADGVAQTIGITLAAFAVAAVLGLPLAVLRRSGHWLVRLPAVVVVEVLRAVPPIVWLFLIYFSLGSTDNLQLTTFQAAVIGLGLIYAAHLSEAYRAGLDAVPAGQWEATRALALPRTQAYVRVILPQALIVVIPPMATFAIALLKDSAIASVIGATDITFQAVQLTQQDLNGLGNFTVAGLLYIALGIPFAVVARGADRVLSRRLVGA